MRLTWYHILACLSVVSMSWSCMAAHDDRVLLLQKLYRLREAYPGHIMHISEHAIVWKDGTVMPVYQPYGLAKRDPLDNPSLADHVALSYPAGRETWNRHASQDPGRSRYHDFLPKMYGRSKEEVEKNLVTMMWMPKSFGTQYPLRVTRINGIDAKLKKISEECDALPERFKIFLKNPGGTFCWRTIAGTNRASAHSFGMTIDINVSLSHYWQWDYRKEQGLSSSETVSEHVPLTFRNTIPWEIVSIFEKYGFIWGGKWHHYDTMHFEYRPELFERALSS